MLRDDTIYTFVLCCNRKPFFPVRYENVWSELRRFHERLSGLAWSVQTRFKEVYDNAIVYRGTNSRRSAMSDSDSDGFAGRNGHQKKMLAALDLKQLHRSVKYMTAAEREARRRELDAVREVRIVGEFRGEWENEHIFMCTVCAEPYDELREVSDPFIGRCVVVI